MRAPLPGTANGLGVAVDPLKQSEDGESLPCAVLPDKCSDTVSWSGRGFEVKVNGEECNVGEGVLKGGLLQGEGEVRGLDDGETSLRVSAAR